MKAQKQQGSKARRYILPGLILGVLYLLNASWLAPAPPGGAAFVAQRGVHQVYRPGGIENDTCTAQRIAAVTHGFIDNSIPSIAAAFEKGADVVEVDVRRTGDGEFVLFHDVALECRTDGRGRVDRTSLAELKQLDIGYGYTADDGRTFPLRGRGRGLMPTLEEALRAFPRRRFMIQFKDNHRKHADALVAYLEARGLADWKRVSFFGANRSVRRLEQIRPQADTWTDKGAVRCTRDYMLLGWSGHVPASCRGGLIFLPTNLRHLVWGWPNRFLYRMRRNDVKVLAVGEVDLASPGDFSRVDRAEQLYRLPKGYDGMIWTDRIEQVGPLARYFSGSR